MRRFYGRRVFPKHSTHHARTLQSTASNHGSPSNVRVITLGNLSVRVSVTVVMTDHGESFNIIRGIEIEALFVASLE